MVDVVQKKLVWIIEAQGIFSQKSLTSLASRFFSLRFQSLSTDRFIFAFTVEPLMASPVRMSGTCTFSSPIFLNTIYEHQQAGEWESAGHDLCNTPIAQSLAHTPFV